MDMLVNDGKAKLGLARATEMWERILWSVAASAQLMSTPKGYGTGELWHSQEMHLLVAVGEVTGSNVSQLADHLSVTRSAISQAVRKLERRGVLRRYKTADNQKEVLFALTQRGETVTRAHRRFHERVETEITGELAMKNSRIAESLELVAGLLERRAGRIREIMSEE